MIIKSKLIVISVLAATAVSAGVIVWRHNARPDFANMNPEQMRQFFDPNRMRNMSDGQRREFREAMQERATKEVKGYFTVPEQERTAYLDNVIDRMQERRSQFRLMARFDANTPDANSRFRFRPRDPNAQRQFRAPNVENMRARSEMVDAETRSQMAKYRQDLRRRMEQRGIQGPMMGRGGPGGGFEGRGFGGPGGGGRGPRDD